MTQPPDKSSTTFPASDDDNLSTMTDKTSNTFRSQSMTTIRVKFEFRVTENKPFVPSTAHKEILDRITELYPQTTILTNQDNSPVNSITCDSNYFHTHFHYLRLPKSNHSIVAVGHSILSNTSFNALKEAAQPLLQRYKCFFRINKWENHELDIRPVGWLYKVDPNTHSRDHLRSIISAFAVANNIPSVPLELYSKKISNRNSSASSVVVTQAIFISCRRHDYGAAKHLVQSCFEKQDTRIPGKFIPNDLVQNHGIEAFTKYLKLQNKYLTHLRTIGMNGLDENAFTLNFSYKNKTTSLNDLLHECEWISWCSPTTKTHINGRFLFTTTNEKFEAALSWLKSFFLHQYQNLSQTNSLKQFAKTPTITTMSKDDISKADSYGQSLVTAISDLSESSYSNPPNSWSQPPSIISPPTISASTSKTVSSSITMASQISELTNLVQSLKQEVSNQLLQHEKKMETLVADTINLQMREIEKSNQEVIAALNAKWQATLIRQQEKAIADIDQTVDSIIASQKSASHPTTPQSKHLRAEATSGSSQPKKQLKPSRDDLLSVKSKMISKLMQDQDNA